MTKPQIKKPATADVIFRYAESFAEAAENALKQARRAGSNKTHINDAADLAPAATLDSLALELYFKCLQTIELGHAQRTHDFEQLFAALPKGTRDAVRTMYNAEIAGSPIAAALAKNHPDFEQGLDSFLKNASRVFETSRYLYEGTGGKTMFYWPVTRYALRKTILAINPGWAKPKV